MNKFVVTLAVLLPRVLLPPDKFPRIHRSWIVNVDRVKELFPLFHGDYAVILKNGQQFTLSTTYRARLRI